jgi:sigma-B regulation protein RsbU (phosphoserine phosphatase)
VITAAQGGQAYLLAPAASASTGTLRHKVLIVDDEEMVLKAMRELLGSEETLEITTTPFPEKALKCLASQSYAVVLADQRMPLVQGTCLLEKARQLSPDTVRILLTGYPDARLAIEAINRGRVFRFIAKPWEDEELRRAVHQAVAEHERLAGNGRHKNGRSAALAYQQEIEMGARIQRRRLLGRPFRDLQGLKLGLFAVPAQQIDGDFYDFFRHGGTCLDLVIGDVMGKGVPAALLGAAIEGRFPAAISALMTSSSGELPEPEQVVNMVHAELTAQLMELESFVTVCYARFDLKQRLAALVNCGHTRTAHFQRRANGCFLLGGNQMPLGFSKGATYRQHQVPLEEGDVFIFYSDGIVEAQNGKGELFGEERLARLIRANGRRDPQEIAERIRETLASFSGAEAFADDLTCVVIRIQAGAACDFPVDPARG